MEFRQDIQVLRGIAVIFVVLFHLGTPGFASGFLGVDVFFVISGYLMQRLYGHSGGVAGFYRRRARRLLPAYFATILCVLAVAYFLTLPTEYRQVGQQSVWASAFSSNVGFWMQASYFEKTNFNPLLHLWSLGVEFHFYLVFPLIFFLTKKRLWLLLLILAGSLAACLFVTGISPKTSFFLMPLRLWEFAFGIVAARCPERPNPWIGLACCIGMLCLPLLPIDGQLPSAIWGHPGLAAVFAAAVTAGTLIWRLPEPLLNSLPLRALSGLGGVSYSLYLVHFPIIVLMNYAPFGGTNIGASTAMLPMILALLATATPLLYLLFEKRAARIYRNWRAVAAAVATAAVALALPSLQLRSFDDQDQKIFAAWFDKGEYRCGKIFRLAHPGQQTCRIAGESGPTILLVGDSHADALKQAFAAIVNDRGGQLFLTVANDPLVNSNLGPAWVVSQAKALGARTVYFHYARDNLRPDQVLAAYRALKAEGINSALIAPVPDYSVNIPQSLYANRHDGSPHPVQSIADHEARNAAFIAFAQTNGLPLIDLGPTLCTPVCQLASPSGEPYYSDGAHLSLTGARAIEPVLAASLAMLPQDRPAATR